MPRTPITDGSVEIDGDRVVLDVDGPSLDTDPNPHHQMLDRLRTEATRAERELDTTVPVSVSVHGRTDLHKRLVGADGRPRLRWQLVGTLVAAEITAARRAEQERTRREKEAARLRAEAERRETEAAQLQAELDRPLELATEAAELRARAAELTNTGA